MKDRKPYFRAYFAAHREEMNARSRRWRRLNPEKVREQGRRRRERNKASVSPILAPDSHDRPNP